MSKDIRTMVARMGLMGSMRAMVSDARRAAAMVLRPGRPLREAAEGIALQAQRHAEETGTWIDPDRAAAADGGPFDTCDLRLWLALAERAGVPFVPAHEILRLTHDETVTVMGDAPLSPRVQQRMTERLRATLTPGELDAMKALEDERERRSEGQETGSPPSRMDLLHRAADAGNGLPAGWMVRHARCASSSLKGLVGTGLGMREPPEVRFSSSLEVGPGWVRLGNNRLVDVLDHRILSVGIVPGPEIDQVWLARPWMDGGRLLEAEDIHRAGSPFAGRGEWPAEWRVFVRGGRVTGVSSYYAWAGGREPVDAAMALAAAEMGQRLADTIAGGGFVPRFADLELARFAPEGSPVREAIDGLHPRDDIAFCVDFLETRDGLLLLEGGPPYTPIGGAFPCAFAGTGDVEGVALHVMPGINLAEPRTWRENGPAAPREGCILSWEEARELASRYDPLSAGPRGGR